LTIKIVTILTGPSASMAPPKSKGITDIESATQKENTRWSNNVPNMPIGVWKKKGTQQSSTSNEFLAERNEEDTDIPEEKEISSILSGMKQGHTLKEMYDQGMVPMNTKQKGLTTRGNGYIDDNKGKNNEIDSPVQYWN
jgi:hypothetical protein